MDESRAASGDHDHIMQQHDEQQRTQPFWPSSVKNQASLPSRGTSLGPRDCVPSRASPSMLDMVTRLAVTGSPLLPLVLVVLPVGAMVVVVVLAVIRAPVERCRGPRKALLRGAQVA